MGLVVSQTVAAAALAAVAGYAIARLPFVPPGDWTAIEPAPERLVELVDTPFLGLSVLLVLLGGAIIGVAGARWRPRDQG